MRRSSPGNTGRLNEHLRTAPSMPTWPGSMLRVTGSPASRPMPASCAAASRMMAPGTIGQPGKWPAKIGLSAAQCAVPSKLSAASTVAWRIKSMGGRCGKKPKISSALNWMGYCSEEVSLMVLKIKKQNAIQIGFIRFSGNVLLASIRVEWFIKKQFCQMA